MTKVRKYQSPKSGKGNYSVAKFAGKMMSVKEIAGARLMNYKKKQTSKSAKDGSIDLPEDDIRVIANKAVENGFITVNVEYPDPKDDWKPEEIAIENGFVGVAGSPKRPARKAKPGFERLSPQELVEREYQRHARLMDLLAQ